jgi:hypothetical protein
MPIIEKQSWAFDIRDTFYNVVTVDPFFAAFNAQKNRMLPVQPDQLPYLGVYLGEETNTPDGDGNAACIRFTETARIVFSVITANNDRAAAEAFSDQSYLKIKSLLFTDLNVMNVWNGKNIEGVMIESIARGTRRHIYGNAGQNNETPWIDMQYDVQAVYRTEWYPDITDMLDEIDVTTGVKAGDTPAEMANRIQVAPVYVLNTSRQRRAPLGRPWLLARDQNRRGPYGHRHN